ncbi:hypothetical protein DW728_01235 [Streptococcus parasanguinis]|nr:hypothetical protein DW728_01235 [Streptococcus parasanguinis]
MSFLVENMQLFVFLVFEVYNRIIKQRKKAPSMMTKLKRYFLHLFLKHTSVYLKDQKLLLSEKEKLDLFKQIFRSIKQVLQTNHVKEEGS